jgi:hypothetical protein
VKTVPWNDGLYIPLQNVEGYWWFNACRIESKVECRIHFFRDNGLLDFVLDKVQKSSISKCNIASSESP